MKKIKNIISYYFSSKYNLKFFWNKNKNHKNIPKDLKKIFTLFLNSKSYTYCSRYWQKLNIKNLRQIIHEGGIKNYANTVALNYFNFIYLLPYFFYFSTKPI